MAVNDLVDSLFPQLEKCGNERVNKHTGALCYIHVLFLCLYHRENDARVSCCVIHPWVHASWSAQYFTQIYNFAAFRDKEELTRFFKVKKVTVMTRQKYEQKSTFGAMLNNSLNTVKPLMLACPLCHEFREPNITAKLKGANINCRTKMEENYYSILNCMVLIRQNKGSKIILHAKSPTFRAAKLRVLQ